MAAAVGDPLDVAGDDVFAGRPSKVTPTAMRVSTTLYLTSCLVACGSIREARVVNRFASPKYPDLEL